MARVRQMSLVTLILLISLQMPISNSAIKSCSVKANTSQAKIGQEKLLGSFTGGGVFSFLQIDQSLFLLAERSKGGSLTLLDSQTGEISGISTGLQNVRDMFKLVKSPKFSLDNPEIYFSALMWGDLNTPRSGRRASEPAMKNILPSGLSVFRGTLNFKSKTLENLKEIYKQSNYLVSGSNYGGALAFSKDGKNLFISVGDEGDYDKAQQLDSEIGKILRVTLDGDFPKDNPYQFAGANKNFCVWL